MMWTVAGPTPTSQTRDTRLKDGDLVTAAAAPPVVVMDTTFCLMFMLPAALLMFSGHARGGEWGPWESVSSCSVTCGYGTHTRMRQWKHSESDGATTSGRTETQEHQVCVRGHCPDDLCHIRQSTCRTEVKNQGDEVQNVIRSNPINITNILKACSAFQQLLKDCEEYFLTHCSGVQAATLSLNRSKDTYRSLCGPEEDCQRQLWTCQPKNKTVEAIKQAQNESIPDPENIQQACRAMENSTERCLEGLANNCLQFAWVNDSLAELTKLQQNLCSQEMICQAKLRRCQHISNESSGWLIGQVASEVDVANRAKLCQYYTAVRRCIDVDVDESCWRHPAVARVSDVIRHAEQDICFTTPEKPTHEHEGIFLHCPQLVECLQANDTQCSAFGDTLGCLQKTEYDCGVGQNQPTLELLREKTLAACSDIVSYEKVFKNCTTHRNCLQKSILWNASVANETSGTTVSDKGHYMITLCERVDSFVGCLTDATRLCPPGDAATAAKLQARRRLIEQVCQERVQSSAVAQNQGNHPQYTLPSLASGILFSSVLLCTTAFHGGH